jgi:two-component system chemotaxis response regulator CheB
VASEDPIRVLVVDDSALMRKVLSDLLASDARIEIVGTARDGIEAIELTRSKRPDVVTLDVEMPGLSGIDTIPALLAVREVPIVMVSAFTQEGAEVTLEALERGAVDFMPKPDKNQITQLRALREVLLNKVLTAAQSRVRRKPGRVPTASAPGATATAAQPRAVPPREERAERSSVMPTMCVGIGISTGGPQTLTQTIAQLEPPIPPILVVQHMPAQFTSVLAQRLDRVGRVRVKEAADSDLVLPDQILIANGALHMTLIGRPPFVRVSLCDDPPVSGHKPSVDVLFKSLARIYQNHAVGIMMTGMGRDGVEGCKQILQAGGRTLGQDEATSIVYGMNKAAFEEGAIQSQFALEQLPSILRSFVREGTNV